MKRFVPRQRKHKVLARAKESGRTAENGHDSNVIEHIPAAKADRDEKKRILKEQLRSGLPKVSGKKAKRLEKYIETKLRKDENRELIEKLASSKTDTSLYQSSKKLGRGKETKKEQLSRTLKNARAGIDIDGQNEEILFEKTSGTHPSVEDAVSSDTEEIAQRTSEQLASEEDTNPTLEPSVSVGVGLKRPLEVDDSGRPILKKRKRRGGVKSKLSVKHKTQFDTDSEPSWDGFGSNSDVDIASSDESQHSQTTDGHSVHGIPPEEILSAEDAASSLGSERELTEESEDGSSATDPEDEAEAKQQRSTAFKTWANQQRDKALGFESSSIIQDATETARIQGFKPRAPEEDPLPPELQSTMDSTRKAFTVSINRPPEIQEARLKLPVVAEEQKIMEAIHNNTTVVIYGATGSGKTTQVPQFLYEAGYGSAESPTPGMIGVTQPRRVAAVSMAKRVGDELGDHGRHVSYQIRFEGSVGPETAIKFMTDGVLLREVAQDIALRKYSAIIIDEAHERSVNTDILIGMVSRVIRLRAELALEDASIKPLKLIIMSATLRVTDFTENTTLFPIPPPVLQAEGRQYPVTCHFARKTHHDYVDEAFRKITKGHRKLPPGGFLVFLTGQNEITQLSKLLKEAFRTGSTAVGPKVQISGYDAPIEAEDVNFGHVLEDDSSDEGSIDLDIDDKDDFDVGEAESGPSKIHVLPLYSLLPTREQLKVFEPPADGARMIVLATNVAETSLTIPGIRYVFDCGRSKERKFDRQTGIQSFEIGWISKASASQRAGRAGRTGPGHCYRLYSSAVYERDFAEFAEPEILRMPIEGVVLQLKAMNLQHVVNFPFPTPPDRRSLASSEKLLTYLSAISPSGSITPLGTTMSIFPLSPRFAKALLIGHMHDCLPYTIALVAGLSAADVFIPENQAIPITAPKVDGEYFSNADHLEEDARDLIRRKFNKVQKDFCSLDDKSDAIKLLQVVGEYAHEPTEIWCQHHFVRSKVLREILQLRRQITELLRVNLPAFANLKFQEKLERPSEKQVRALKQMVAAGFIDHVAIRSDLAPDPPVARRKPTRATDIPYLTLFPSHARHDEEDKAVYIHPSSPLAHISAQECPDYIVYSYLQRSAPSAATPDKVPRTRMHALTDITGGQLATLAKGTSLLHYGKPIKEVMPKTRAGASGAAAELVRECWVVPYLRAEATGGLGWPLPARKVRQTKVPGQGWVVS
ncbi:MAG: putative ATP-dependent RNA helicase DHR1 [Claussenomyces sp. TS43310]|nr:MAG: putative ATP-dependent RNA helicase DHR1 [Claussenomyces sp. TS43310]